MDVTLRIRRYNPEVDVEPHWEEYVVEAEPTDRVLDLLHQVKWYQDGTLTFRRSCAHGVCGSDAMIINGVGVFWQNIIVGLVLLLAVSLVRFKQRHRR